MGPFDYRWRLTTDGVVAQLDDDFLLPSLHCCATCSGQSSKACRGYSSPSRKMVTGNVGAWLMRGRLLPRHRNSLIGRSRKIASNLPCNSLWLLALLTELSRNLA